MISVFALSLQNWK